MIKINLIKIKVFVLHNICVDTVHILHLVIQQRFLNQSSKVSVSLTQYI